MLLRDRTAIVTGSARGIGKAIAERFAREGAKVAVNYLNNKAKADDVVAGIERAGGIAVAIQADVAKRKDANRLVARTIEAFGGLDIMVSNAGVINDKPFIESTDEDWDSAINTNLRGFFNMAQASLPHMIEQKRGRILVTNT